MNEAFKKQNPENKVAIPGYVCKRKFNKDGSSWLRIRQTGKNPKHIITVYSDGTATAG